MNLIPTPKDMRIGEGYLRHKACRLPDELPDERLNKALLKLPVAQDGAMLSVDIRDEGSDAYTLCVKEDQIEICARGVSGAFYAIQTLRQIFTHEEIPCLTVEDAPDFAYRGFYHDITRGKVPTVETLKSLIDKVAYYKGNSFQLYIEHTFAFREFADSIQKTGYLSPEEIRELDDYCFENFIEMIPSVATFGHLYELLQKEEYREICEIPDYEPRHIAFHERMVHHTIDPTNPKSAALVKSLIDQLMPLFRSDKFNICGDETFDLQTGRHKGQDTGRLYVDFIRKTAGYLKSQGKTVMMWADVLLNHPGVIGELPDGIVFLNWDYAPFPSSEERFRIFKEKNLTQIVCPAVATYAWMTENVAKEVHNIDWITEYGQRYGAAGILNTNWGDYGNPCSLEVSMYGFLYGAEKSWNAARKADGQFDRSVDHLLYQSAHGSAAIKELSRFVTLIDWRDFVKMYSDMIFPDPLYPHLPTYDEIERIRYEYLDFKEKYQNEIWGNDEYRREMLIQAEGITVVAELMGKAQGFSINRITETESWLEKFEASWRARNKESELGAVSGIFRYVEKKVSDT